MIAKPPKLGIVTCWFNQPHLVLGFERAVLDADSVTVVDNASEPEAADLLRAMCARHGWRYLPQKQNLGFAGGMNAGMCVEDSDIVVCLNNDIEADRPGWIARFKQFCIDDAKRGPALYGANMNLQIVAGIRCPYLDGWFLGAWRRDWWNDGTLHPPLRWNEERYSGVGYWTDNDLCLRAADIGHRLVVVPDLGLRHLGNATSSVTPGAYDHSDRNREVFAATVGAMMKPEVPEDSLGAELVRAGFEHLDPALYNWQVEQMNAHIDWRGKHVLELGAMDGRHSEAALYYGAKSAVAVEGKQHLVDHARDISIRHPAFVCADVRECVELKSSLHEDAILCFGLLYHLEAPATFLMELALRMQPGAWLVISTHCADGPLDGEDRGYEGRWWHEGAQVGDAIAPGRSLWLSAGALKQCLADCKLEVVDWKQCRITGRPAEFIVAKKEA